MLELSQVEPSSPVWLWHSASLFGHRFYSSPRCFHQSAQCPSESACLTQGPFAPSGFHRLSSLLWAPPTPGPSSPKCYYLPLQTLQLDPSLGRVSQVPGCSFRARCPTLPRKVPLGFVSSPPPGCWLPFARGSWPLSSFRFEAFIRRFTFVAAHSFAGQRLQTVWLPSRLLRPLHV